MSKVRSRWNCRSGSLGSVALGIGFFSVLTYVPCSNLFSQESGNSEQPQSFAKDLPRLPPTEPLNTLSDFAIQPGYRLELAASEPLVRDPVAMSFDEQGRMYIVEMCDYSEQDNDYLGTIKLLTDDNEDGVFDTSVTFVDKLSWPTGIICFDGGVFVAAAPDIWFFKDEDGDGIAEIRNKVFSGFGRSNVQGLLNSFCWSLDNRIYCQISVSGASISRPDKPDVAPVNANGRDFSFDPRTLNFRLESGGGQHGMSFDDWGRRFTCSNSDHLQLFLYPDRYIVADSPFPLPPSRRSIAADGPQANVHRISPVEPWRIIRTRLRVTNQTPGMIEGGGRAAGYFTSATGVTIYRGDKFPTDMAGTAIVGDVGSNIVHRKKLTDIGISQIGERIDQDAELIASKDIWFRPVQFSNAPDGTLYIADLYREVIEHPRSLPPEIKQHLDLTSGRDRGRIYRLVPESPSSRISASLNFTTASDADLVTALGHSNGWHRDTASRLLYERLTSIDFSKEPPRRDALIAAIKAQAKTGKTPQGRLHALGLLAPLEEAEDSLVNALNDDNARVREWAIQWCEAFFTSNKLAKERLPFLASDDDDRVRFQLALSLSASGLTAADKADIAYQILSKSSDEPYTRAACFNAIDSQAVGILQQELVMNLSPEEVTKLLPIAQIAGRRSSQQQLADIDRILATSKQSPIELQSIQVQILDALQTRIVDSADMEKFLSKLPTLDRTRNQLIAGSRDTLADDSQTDKKRMEALKYLQWNADQSDIKLLVNLFLHQNSEELRTASANALRRMSSNEVPTQLLAIWSKLTPRQRATVLDIVFSRATWTDVLLDVAEQGNFNLVDLDVTRLNALRNGARTKERADRLVAGTTEGSRAEVYEAYRKSLNLDGNRERGKQVFAKACAACHKVDGVGYEIGPNLVSFQFRGAEAILQNVIEPNREVNPQFVSYTIMTHDERVLTGMITNETAANVTLMRGENQSDTIEKSEIAEMKSSRLSLMPEGLEQQIDHQSMADLLEYLTTLE